MGSRFWVLGSPLKVIYEEVNGWWEWPPATITRKITITPLKSSGMHAKTAPTIPKQPIQNYKVSLSI
jgi:hypothetical protein